jgi:hypothetical protein
MINLGEFVAGIFFGIESPSPSPAKESRERLKCPYKGPADEKRKSTNFSLTLWDYDCINCSGYNRNCKRYETKR